ncbi:MAG: VOC family protein [Bacteroidetes bacterium]|jgi:glyoxylase I family protein|nr:VOC family protein [Bacteroidota bacterium]
MSSANDTPPSSIRLDHASVMTKHLDRAIRFYVDLLGLSLRTIEDDPIRTGRRRAMLTDDAQNDVIELIEMTDLDHKTIPGQGGIHHIGFRLPVRDWHSLRTRLDAESYPYQETNGCLFIRDADGLVLEIEQDGS